MVCDVIQSPAYCGRSRIALRDVTISLPDPRGGFHSRSQQIARNPVDFA